MGSISIAGILGDPVDVSACIVNFWEGDIEWSTPPNMLHDGFTTSAVL